MVMAATVDLPRQASTSSPQTRLWGGNIKSRGSLMILFFYWTLYWSFESKFNKIGRKLGPHRCSEVRCIEPTVGAPSHLIHRGSNQMSCLDWRVKSTPSSDIGPPSIWGTCYVDIWGVWEGGICGCKLVVAFQRLRVLAISCSTVFISDHPCIESTLFTLNTWVVWSENCATKNREHSRVLECHH